MKMSSVDTNDVAVQESLRREIPSRYGGGPDGLSHPHTPDSLRARANGQVEHH